MNISQGKWSYTRSSLSSLLGDHRHRVLHWVPPKASPETRMYMQMVYLGGHRKYQQGSREVRQGSKVASNERCITEQIPAVSNWGSVLMGNSGKRYRRCFSYPNWGAKIPGFLSSSLLQFIGWELLLGNENSWLLQPALVSGAKRRSSGSCSQLEAHLVGVYGSDVPGGKGQGTHSSCFTRGKYDSRYGYGRRLLEVMVF